MQAKINNVCFVDNNGIKIEKACWGQIVNIYLVTEFFIHEEIIVEVWDDDTLLDDEVASINIKKFDGKPIQLKLETIVSDKTGTVEDLYVKVFATKLTLLNPDLGFTTKRLLVKYDITFSNAIIGEENGLKKHILVDYDDVSWFYVNTTGVKAGTKLTTSVYIYNDKGALKPLLALFPTKEEDGVYKGRIQWSKISKIKKLRRVFIMI